MTTPRRVFLLLSLVVTAAAWSLPAPSRPTSTALDASSNRRSFLSGTTVVATAILQLTTYPTAASAAATKQDAALTQWKASVATIDNLMENWGTISKGGGDAIRKELGTANFGTEISPLFQIDKAFRILIENDDIDVIEFTEKSEEFTNALAGADAMAYSANFAGGSGKPTAPKVYIDKAKTEVEGMQKIAKSLSSLL